MVCHQLQTYLTKDEAPETEQIGGRVIVCGSENECAGMALLVPWPCDGLADTAGLWRLLEGRR